MAAGRGGLVHPGVTDPWSIQAGPGLVEVPPTACRSGHRWGQPVGDVTLYTVGSPTCSCRYSRGGHHRAYWCEKPGCPTPETRVGRCEFDPDNELTWPPGAVDQPEPWGSTRGQGRF